MCAKHIINRTVVELTIPSSGDAHKAQRAASGFFKTSIFPMIGRVLDNLDIKNEVIRVEKLELDLKNFHIEKDNTPDLIKLEQQIKEKLEKIIRETKNPEIPGKVIAVNKCIPADQLNEDLFFYVLRNGVLPWWAPQDKPVVLEDLANQLLETSSENFTKELQLVLKNANARKRISKLSDKINERLIEINSEHQLKVVNKLLAFTNGLAFTGFRQLVYSYALAAAGPEISVRKLVQEVLEEKPDIELAKQLYELCLSKTAESGIENDNTSTEIKQALACLNNIYWGRIKKIFNEEDRNKYFEAGITETEHKKTTDDQNKNARSEKENDIGSLIVKGDAEAIVRYSKKMEDEKPTSKEKYSFGGDNESESTDVTENNNNHYIKNAGLVILTPYVAAFFKELELSDGKKFYSSKAAEKAAHLLQYLATGGEALFEEHDMILNKILCGIETTTPFTLNSVLTEKEKEESKGLLQAVADNWTALKGTSGDSLRDTFFMREGILEQQANGWNLKVEKTTIDILLDKLPWGISIVKLPWTETMIFVNW